MQFNTKRLTAATAVLAATALTFGAPAATAGGTSSHHHHRSITAPVKFTILDTDVTGNDQPIVVSQSPLRLLHERGWDHVVNDNEDMFKFPNGTLDVNHHATWQRDRFDRVTGLFSHVERGRWVDNQRGDTGIFRHSSGRGHYFAKVVGVAGMSNDPASNPQIIETDIVAKGHITLRLRHHHPEANK